MGYARGRNFKTLPINIVGSSVFGIYTKQSTERTFNMTISDNWLVPYPGYKVGLKNNLFEDASRGRGLYQSVRLNKMFAVFDQSVYKIDVGYDHVTQEITSQEITLIGNLNTAQGVVYFAENNKPQILISDSTTLYLYDESLQAGSESFTTDEGGAPSDPKNFTINGDVAFAIGEPCTFTTDGGTLPTVSFNGSPSFVLSESVTYYIGNISEKDGNTLVQISPTPLDAANNITFDIVTDGNGANFINTQGPFQQIPVNFTPGYISFHDTYFLSTGRNDTFYAPPAQNTWRLSAQNNGFIWPSIAQNVGLLESKSDIIQAVTRFPSRGNMILVMGLTVTEFWFDTGNQLFPYQRQNQTSIDYGCVSPATVAILDDIVVWLGQNEKSGPIVMYTKGSEPQKITTDGIDFQLSQINNPEDSQGFLFRKNGHLFYHLNFYTDNFSYVFDLTTNRIFNATDECKNYYIMGQVVWYQNQYFSVSRNKGNLYVFDTVFNTYEDTTSTGETIQHQVPRSRFTQNVRLPSQDYFVVNDMGFVIESGETDYIYQNQGSINLLTEDGNNIETEGALNILMLFENENIWTTENGLSVASEQEAGGETALLISEQDKIIPVTPRVDLSISYDGGATFSSNFPYELPHVGKRRNRLMWWNLGIGNDVVFQINFWNVGAVVADTGIVNIR